MLPLLLHKTWQKKKQIYPQIILYKLVSYTSVLISQIVCFTFALQFWLLEGTVLMIHF